MRTILLIVDDETCREYEEFSPETKQLFTQEVSMLLKKVARDARCAKLNKIIQDLNNEDDQSPVNTDLLFKLLPID